MDQRPNSTNTTNTASLELLPLFKESKEQEDESIIRRKRSSSCFVDQPSKMSRSELLYKAVFFQGCQLLVIMEKGLLATFKHHTQLPSLLKDNV
ncbi:hypothetical protein S83_019272 [Arachis hypogaea]